MCVSPVSSSFSSHYLFSICLKLASLFSASMCQCDFACSSPSPLSPPPHLKTGLRASIKKNLSAPEAGLYRKARAHTHTKKNAWDELERGGERGNPPQAASFHPHPTPLGKRGKRISVLMMLDFCLTLASFSVLHKKKGGEKPRGCRQHRQWK